MSSFDTSLHFNWLPRVSVWQELQNWRDQQANASVAADTTSAIISKMSGAATNQVEGSAKLAAQAALDRVNAAIKVKQNAHANASSSTATKPSAPTSINLSTGESIPIDPALTLAGGSKVNLNDGTLTLSDGTVIDIKTGLKKAVDVTV
jgi:hypothetical protein